MKISPVSPIKGPHRYIRKETKDSPKLHYRNPTLSLVFNMDALYATLCKLRPKVCLEIGTHMGDSAGFFQSYFDEYCNDGWLLTVDIKKYVEIEEENIKQTRVYPHVKNFKKHHKYVEDNDLLNGFQDVDDSVEKNCAIIQNALNDAGFDKFDFVFIDGDHQEDSFIKDIEIAKNLTHTPHYILLDDVFDYLHECAAVFHDNIKHQYHHCLFEDWQNNEEILSSKGVSDRDKILAGAALIWEKQ